MGHAAGHFIEVREGSLVSSQPVQTWIQGGAEEGEGAGEGRHVQQALYQSKMLSSGAMQRPCS